MFAPDVSIYWFGYESRTEWEKITAFRVGEETILTPPECEVTGPAESATVSCVFESLDALIQAVDAPPVPTRFTAVVTTDGIVSLRFRYSGPDFLNAAEPFNAWIAKYHPDAVEATEFGGWATVDAAKQAGRLQAQFAQEWAVFLDENGCGFEDGC